MELSEKFQLDGRHAFNSADRHRSHLHLYEELGLDMLHAPVRHVRLCAVGRAGTQTLHLARDRYGIKPLFYASRTMAPALRVRDQVHPQRPAGSSASARQALHDFLTFDYMPGTQTAFEEYP